MHRVAYLGSIGIEGGVIVGFAQQGLEGQQYCAHAVGCAPLVLQDVQADVTILVHVRVEAGCLKLH